MIPKTRSWEEVQQHFRDYYATAPYYEPGQDWVFYAPAYRFGWQAALHPEYQNRSWIEIEGQLAWKWKEQLGLYPPWESIKPAVRDAWERAHNSWGRADETTVRIVWNHRRHPFLRLHSPDS